MLFNFDSFCLLSISLTLRRSLHSFSLKKKVFHPKYKKNEKKIFYAPSKNSFTGVSDWKSQTNSNDTDNSQHTERQKLMNFMTAAFMPGRV